MHTTKTALTKYFDQLTLPAHSRHRTHARAINGQHAQYQAYGARHQAAPQAVDCECLLRAQPGDRSRRQRDQTEDGGQQEYDQRGGAATGVKHEERDRQQRDKVQQNEPGAVAA